MASTIIAPLGNIACPGVQTIGKGITIEAVPAHLTPIIQQARDTYVIRHPPKYTRCLVARNAEFVLGDTDAVKKFLENVVLLLRIYKPGNVYFNFAIVDHTGWYDASTVAVSATLQQIGVFFYMGWGHKGLVREYEIESHDVEPLRDFIEAHRGEQLMAERPFRYFFRGYHEPYSEDRFLSNVIGMENVLVNDGSEQSNIRYKFIDRGCYLLQVAEPHEHGASHYTHLLKKIYDARCKLVHSGKTEIDWNRPDAQELLRSSEDSLRSILRLVLQRPELKDAGRIDEHKRRLYR